MAVQASEARGRARGRETDTRAFAQHLGERPPAARAFWRAPDTVVALASIEAADRRRDRRGQVTDALRAWPPGRVRGVSTSPWTDALPWSARASRATLSDAVWLVGQNARPRPIRNTDFPTSEHFAFSGRLKRSPSDRGFGCIPSRVFLRTDDQAAITGDRLPQCRSQCLGQHRLTGRLGEVARLGLAIARRFDQPSLVDHLFETADRLRDVDVVLHTEHTGIGDVVDRRRLRAPRSPRRRSQAAGSPQPRDAADTGESSDRDCPAQLVSRRGRRSAASCATGSE